MEERGADATSGQEPRDATAQGVERIVQAVEGLTSAARVGAAFGEPFTVGDRTVIPAAEVMCGLGLGLGAGEGPAGDKTARTAGWGGGAGGGARSRPVAAIVIEPEGVRVQPILDVSQLALAGMTAGVFSLLWIGRLLRKGKAMEDTSDRASIRGAWRLLRHR